MWTIVYKGKPITVEQIEKMEGRNWDLEHPHQYISARYKKTAIEMYLFYVGFSWEERIAGVECKRIKRGK